MEEIELNPPLVKRNGERFVTKIALDVIDGDSPVSTQATSWLVGRGLWSMELTVTWVCCGCCWSGLRSDRRARKAVVRAPVVVGVPEYGPWLVTFECDTTGGAGTAGMVEADVL
jgi:hypothetical protein